MGSHKGSEEQAETFRVQVREGPSDDGGDLVCFVYSTARLKVYTAKVNAKECEDSSPSHLH